MDQHEEEQEHEEEEHEEEYGEGENEEETKPSEFFNVKVFINWTLLNICHHLTPTITTSQ